MSNKYNSIVVGNPYSAEPPATDGLYTWKDLQASPKKYVEGYRAQYNAANETRGAYGRCCFVVAARWARAMENRLGEVVPVSGDAFVGIADEAMKEADNTPDMGISGNQYGMAVSILVATWVHGEALRQWHNTQWGSPAASGVLNPAVITMTNKS